MATNEIHLGDIGTTFLITVTDGTDAIDISSATTKQLILADPSGNSSAKTAEFNTDGTDGVLKYITVADDIDETGKWNIQAKFILTGGTWYSEIHKFTVVGNL